MICFGLGCQQLDDALLEQQRAAYAVQGVDESEPVQAGKKRKKQVYVNGEDVSYMELLCCYPDALLLTDLLPRLGDRWPPHNQKIQTHP